MSEDRNTEIAAIQAIYDNDQTNSFKIIAPTRLEFHSSPLVIRILLPLSYPHDSSEPPVVSLDTKAEGIDHKELSELQDTLHDIIEAQYISKKEPVLAYIIEEAREFAAQARGEAEPEAVEAAEEEYVDPYEEKDHRVSDPTIVSSHLGGTTLEDIQRRLPNNLKLLHAELILRDDLRRAYLAKRGAIATNAIQLSGARSRRARDALHDRYAEEIIVFNGVKRQHVGDIVKSGFVMPGQRTVQGKPEEAPPGTYWGKAVSTQTTVDTTLWTAEYSEGKNNGQLPGHKVIMSVFTPGRVYHRPEPARYVLDPDWHTDYDSEIPDEGCYVFFDSVQILPLYVLHLVKKTKTDNEDTDINKHERKARLKEAAKKRLPDGFGPSKGNRFAVDDIAPVQEDEEQWGDFQRTHIFGEFQEERQSKVWRW